jgi:hypothetical protein
MSVLGRSIGSGISQLAASFETNVTSADEGKVTYFDSLSGEWKLLVGVDVTLLSNSLVGVISRVNVDGDTVGGLGQGYIVLKGSVQKVGAVAGQVYFVGATAETVITPPVDSPAIRVGYSQRNNFLYVDLDPESIQVAILNDRVSALEAQVTAQGELLDEIAQEVLAAPVYSFAADDTWGVNPENTNTNFGLDDQWTEGTVEYNANFGADDNWAELVPE